MEEPLPNFTPRVQQAIKIAKQQSIRNKNEIVEPINLLFGIFKVQSSFFDSLSRSKLADKDFSNYLSAINLPSEKFDISKLTYSKKFKNILRNSVEKANSYNHDYVGIEHVLICLLEDPDVALVFKGYNIDPRLLSKQLELSLSDSLEENEKEAYNTEGDQAQESSFKSNLNLSKYCANLTELAAQGKFDKVIGRDSSILSMIEILCRRIKNNPVILGEAGVGKTALVEGLCQKIANSDVPELLLGKNIYSLNLSTLVAGTKYRGQFEERLQDLINEAVADEDCILFIDEFHTITGAGGAEGGLDAANIMKPLLSRGQLKCIGATTPKEYKKTIEKDSALDRRFQPVSIGEPDQKDCLQILNGIISKYETFHQVSYRKNAIKLAVELSCRYINDRNLPDKAIDILDEAGSKVKLKALDKPLESREIEEKLESLIQEEQDCTIKSKKEILSQSIDDLFDEYQTILDSWQKKLSKKKVFVSASDIEMVISEKTKIPLSIISSNSNEKFLNLKSNLSKEIIGQDLALDCIYKSVLRFASGLNEKGKPMGTFLFLGKTGTGKTLTAKKIAKYIFGGEKKIIRFDMGEFSDAVSSNKITGSSPGYVGYEEGSSLVDSVRKNPYSVILFDEIEKAHPEVLKVLLSIMDEAELKDNFGRVADFSNTFIVLTGNLGSEIIEKSSIPFGFSQENSEDLMNSKIKSKVESFFSPEFANRIDELVVFSDFDKESFIKIINIQLKKLNQKLKSKRIQVSLDKSMEDFCLKELEKSNLGARPIERIFNQSIEFYLSKSLLKKEIESGDKIEVLKDAEGNVVIKKVNNTPQEQA
jgi:ATP-dependent Clp protease ATP-binding subunit ClpC